MNLKFVFGEYKVTDKDSWDIEDNKVKDVIECISGNAYLQDPIEFACNKSTLAVYEILENNIQKCIGCVRVSPSFRTEVLIDIILHPSIRETTIEKSKEYYIAIHNKLENILREIGVSEMKDWVQIDDTDLQNIYKELGYKYIDGGINGLGEPTDLFGKRLNII